MDERGEKKMKVRLYDLNMNEIILRGVTWLEFTPEPVTVERFSEKVYNGDIPIGKATNSRLINARLMYEAADYLDYKLLRNELYSLLNPLKSMWAVDENVPGIKWLVDVDSFNPERINGRIAEVSIVFYSAKTYARSIGTSLDPYTFTSDLWSYGMGLLADASAQDYIFNNERSFQVYNPSNVAIDPREHELEIRLIHAGTNSPGVTITNNTTGDVWSYTGSITSGTTLVVDGVVSKKNTVNVVGDTNFGLITLAEGMNNFTITRLSGDFEIRFKFPFLYV